MNKTIIAAIAAAACLAVLPASAAQAKGSSTFKVPRLGYQLPKFHKITFGKVSSSRSRSGSGFFMPASVRSTPRIHIVDPVQSTPRDFTIIFKEVKQ